jgi:hypothetical protein
MLNNINDSYKKAVMKLSFLHCIALAGMLGCCSGSKADSTRISTKRSSLPISRDVIVREVRGTVEYAYDGTGWQKLEKFKLLKPGVIIRTRGSSSVLLKSENQSTFYRIGETSVLQLTPETPEDELVAASRQARLRDQRGRRMNTERLSGTRMAKTELE